MKWGNFRITSLGEQLDRPTRVRLPDDRPPCAPAPKLIRDTEIDILSGGACEMPLDP